MLIPCMLGVKRTRNSLTILVFYIGYIYIYIYIRGKCERLRCKMSRNHEQKMENFYQLRDFDIDDEDFRILRNIEQRDF